MSAPGPSRHFAATQQFGRFWRIVLRNSAAFSRWAGFERSSAYGFSAESL